MKKERGHLQLVAGGRKRTPRLSARRWINKISKAMEHREFPVEKFVLVPGEKSR